MSVSIPATYWVG